MSDFTGTVVDIDGATGISYTPAPETVGNHLRVRVRFMDAANNPEELFSGRAIVAFTDLCARTPHVRNVIVGEVSGISHCAAVTSAHLAAIEDLIISNSGVTSLKSSDFAGLTGLTSLQLGISPQAARFSAAAPTFTTLPADIFSALPELETLIIRGTLQLTQLPAGVFSRLSGLETLVLSYTSLESLPAGVFAGLTSLTSLDLRSNNFATLPADALQDLPRLETLELRDNPEFRSDPLTVPYDLVRTNGMASDASPASLIINIDSSLAYVPNSLRDQSVSLSVTGGTLTVAGSSNSVSSATVSRSTAFTVTQDSSGSETVVTATSNAAVNGLRFHSSLQLFGGSSPATGTVTVSRSTPATPVSDLAPLQPGQTLTVAVSDIADSDGLADPLSLTYEWQRSSTMDFSDTVVDIPDASSTTYTLTLADRGSYIRVKVGFRDEGGSAESLISAGTTQVHASDLCFRNSAVSSAILEAIPDVSECAAVTSGELAFINALDLSGQSPSLTTLEAEDFAGLTGLLTLDLSDNSLDPVPDLSSLATLTTLDLSGNSLTTVPDLSSLLALTTLDLSGNSLTTVPDSSLPTSLTSLDLSSNSLTSVPDLRSLAALTTLNLGSNSLDSVATNRLPVSLTSLDLSATNLTSLPSEALAQLTNLGAGSLDLSNNPSIVAPVPFTIAYEIMQIGEEGTNSDGDTTLTFRLGLPPYVPSELANQAVLSLEDPNSGTLSTPSVALGADFTVTQRGSAAVVLVVTPPDPRVINGLMIGGVESHLFNALATGEIIIEGMASVGLELMATADIEDVGWSG